MLTNYFLSGWIANLGVVPLFSFAFFLSLPVFFSLFFLLIRVCLVREPILKSFILVCNKLFKREFLSFILVVVKVISTNNALGLTANLENLSQDVFLGRGEQIEISLPNIKSFSIGNKEVIKHRHNAKSETIIIKGKSIGFSDMVVWSKANSKKVYRFYVSSKKEQLKKMESLSALKETQLSVKVSGEIIQVEGRVQNLQDYFIVKKLQNLNSKDISFNLSLSRSLRNKIYKDIYQVFLKEGAQHISCTTTDINIYCEYSSSNDLYSVQAFERKYNVLFRNLLKKNIGENYQLSFQFLTIEGTNTNDLSAGIDQIKSTLAQTVEKNQMILETGDIFIQEKDIVSRLISKQTLKAIIDEPFNLRIGTEVPFKTKVKDEIINEWKFSGLQVKGKMKLIKNRMIMSYEAEISSPSSSGISGPKGKSSVSLKKLGAQVLFTLSLDGYSSNTDGIPVFNEIPVLKNFFQTESSSFHHKVVICILNVEKVI